MMNAASNALAGENHAAEKNCPSDYCCIERDFLWGRVPLNVQESVFRELTMCSLIVGGLKEKAITIVLNVSNETGNQRSNQCLGSVFPCSWCYKGSLLNTGIQKTELWIDNAFTLKTSVSPLDKALLTLTAKVSV